jgi:predicted TPR repeat methyltransferase
MLTEARRKGQYDVYVHRDVLDILASSLHARSVDLVVAADVAPYKGSLEGLLRGVAAVLKMGGRFAFTIEALEPHLPLPALLARQHGREEWGGNDSRHAHGSRGWELMPNGRIAHERLHVEALALELGFEIEAAGDGPLRWQVI